MPRFHQHKLVTEPRKKTHKLRHLWVFCFGLTKNYPVSNLPDTRVIPPVRLLGIGWLLGLLGLCGNVSFGVPLVRRDVLPGNRSFDATALLSLLPRVCENTD